MGRYPRHAVKSGIPASANQQGYLENEISRIQKLYQLRQRLVQTAVKELSRVLPETATNTKL